MSQTFDWKVLKVLEFGVKEGVGAAACVDNQMLI